MPQSERCVPLFLQHVIAGDLNGYDGSERGERGYGPLKSCREAAKFNIYYLSSINEYPAHIY